MISLKNNIIAYAISISITLILIFIFLPKQNKISNKEIIKNNKQFIKNVSVKEFDNNILRKPKIQKAIINKPNTSKIDTFYTATVDTVITFYDSNKSFKGLLHLSSSFIDKNEISDKALIGLKVKGALLYESTFAENNNYKSSQIEIEKKNNFGVGIFAGGIFTADRKITYGIGIGIYFNLIN